MDALGARPLTDRGTIVACAHVATFTQADVATSPAFSPLLGVPSNGYDLFIVQYVSEGRPSVPATVTALLYLPTGGANHIPIVAVDHSVAGMGPTCGPTHMTTRVDSLAVPLVGLGYAVVATDYAGMGVDNGMTSYLVGDAEAAATIDAVRALLPLRNGTLSGWSRCAVHPCRVPPQRRRRPAWIPVVRSRAGQRQRLEHVL
jgi:hypothetical protein